MELRSTAKVYLFNKVIAKTSLTKPEFHLLYTVFVKNNNSSRITHIQKTLTAFRRDTGFKYITKYLKQLINKGYVEKNRFHYTVTAPGINVLKDVENRLRKVRLN